MINSLPFFLWVKSGNISRKFLTFILKIFDKNFERLHRYVEKYNVGNLKNAGKETVLRIISDTRPMEGAAEAEPTLEDLYLYYFSEEGTEQ